MSCGGRASDTYCAVVIAVAVALPKSVEDMEGNVYKDLMPFAAVLGIEAHLPRPRATLHATLHTSTAGQLYG